MNPTVPESIQAYHSPISVAAFLVVVYLVWTYLFLSPIGTFLDNRDRLLLQATQLDRYYKAGQLKLQVIEPAERARLVNAETRAQAVTQLQGYVQDQVTAAGLDVVNLQERPGAVKNEDEIRIVIHARGEFQNIAKLLFNLQSGPYTLLIGKVSMKSNSSRRAAFNGQENQHELLELRATLSGFLLVTVPAQSAINPAASQ